MKLPLIFNHNSMFRITLFLLIGTLSLNSCKKEETQRPNVVLILTDDQGWGDLSLHKNPYVQTPNLDKMAAAGASFERYYVSPLCAPTRASLLTGKYHLRTGVTSVTGGYERMRSEETTIAEAFKANGYATGAFGKWHNGEHFPEDPIGQGFEEFYGFCAGHWNNYFDSPVQSQFEMIESEGYLPDVLTTKAIEFIDKNKEESFFCYLPLNIPHSPHQIADKYFDKYKAMGLDDELSSIYGMVENIDDNVGRVLKYLEESGLSENTIVLFMSDNGPNGQRFNGNMKGIKGHVDEGGVRSPLFVNWKNTISENFVISDLAAHIDIFPTLIELCNLNVEKRPDFDGISIADLLTQKQKSLPEREIYSIRSFDGTSQPYPASVRTPQFRWVTEKDGNRLYNMVSDPEQKQDIIDEFPELNRQFFDKFNAWYKRATADLSEDSRIAVPIGYDEVNRVELQAPESRFTGNIRFFEGHGWANDWLTDWKSSSDSIWWELDAVQSQQYDVFVKYACNEQNVGSEFTLSLNDQQFSAKITEVHDPKPIHSPDRIPRKEAYEKVWKEFKIGTINVPEGKHKVYLRAKKIANETVGDIKGLVFRRVD
ncbi:MAG: arylsulfatase A-like enzyme [Spirosomataceae bacterium]|jgi:arylsulfatase A-like enzyme